MVTVLEVRPHRAWKRQEGSFDGCRGTARSGTVCAVEPSSPLLAARLAAGDERALVEVIDTLGPAVHATALRVLGDDAAAQDVVQDVFVELWRHPLHYDEALGTLRTYLSLRARHRAYDVLRSDLRRAGREKRSERLIPPQRQRSPGEEVADAQTASLVREAVRSLPPEQRTVVEMAYYGGLSYRDVARAVGIPEGTAKSRVRLALAKLESVLDRHMLEQS